jgi:hypothetical protein
MKKHLLILTFPLVLLLVLFVLTALRHHGDYKTADETKAVFIKKTETGYKLIRNGAPYYIKGASGNSYLKELAEAGGNTIRVYDTLNLEDILNEAQKNNLAVIVDIYIPRFQTDHNPYSIKENNDLLKEDLREFIRNYKSHPAILFWNLGNELDYPSLLQKGHRIPDINDLKNIFKILIERKSFINTFNELIEIIHIEDPNHPVSTSVSTHLFWKRLLSIHINSPKLDIIGYNIFAPPVKMKSQLDKLSFFVKLMPFYISEWGTEGPWAQEHTAWRAPLETTSTNKGEQYKENYAIITNQYSQSLGSTVFYWGQKQERTHTWFNIFDEEGRKSQVFYELEKIWLNEPVQFNYPPQIAYMLVNDKGEKDNLVFRPNEVINARVLLNSGLDSTLQFKWEIHDEGWNYAGGGVEHNLTQKILTTIENIQKNEILFQAPALEGPYRIFVHINDTFGNFATTNTPFYVLNTK